MAEPSPRLASLDQFRGYTVLVMVFVNFAGGYEHIPKTFGHHHVYCSFADTVMPGFLFCVGMAMRITFLKRAAEGGKRAAYLKAIKRSLGLIFVGCVVYHFTGGFRSWSDVGKDDTETFLLNTIKRGPFEALTHIGVTSLFVLPVIGQAWFVRLGYAVAAGYLHYWASAAGYYEWNLSNPMGIDGGPLGFLSWSIPLLTGSIAADVLNEVGESRILLRLFGCGVLLTIPTAVVSNHHMALMYADLKVTIPLMHPDDVEFLRRTANYWTMSQRAGSITYTTFGAGFSLALFALFRLVVDLFGFRWAYLDLLGRHALVAYVAHDLCMGMVKPFVPKDSPTWYVLLGFGVVLGCLTLILRYFDRNKFQVRL
jgi:predicted acyltransferase